MLDELSKDHKNSFIIWNKLIKENSEVIRKHNQMLRNAKKNIAIGESYLTYFDEETPKLKPIPPTYSIFTLPTRILIIPTLKVLVLIYLDFIIRGYLEQKLI